MIGFFQLDPDDDMHTPVLPDGILEKIPVEDRAKREIVRDSIRNVLNQLGIHNEGRSRTQVQANTQDSLDRLYGKNLTLAVKLNESKKFQRRYEQSSQTESFLFDVESARIRRISEKGVVQDDDSIPNPTILEVEIDPFQAKFNQNYIVYYRNVWRNNEQFIQGYAVRLRPYLEKLVFNEMQFNPTEQGFALEFGTKDVPYVVFGDRKNTRGMLLDVPLQFPLNDMFLSVYLTEESSGMGRALIILIGIVICGAILGGFIAVYRSTRSQIRLANKRQDFVSAVSHELKTPLTVILSNAELLEGAGLAEKPARWSGNIHTEAEQMRTLVEQMLTLARADNGVRPAAMEPLNLSDVATDCVLAFEPVAFESGKPMEYTVQPELTVSGRSAQLRQVADILLDNAVKYAEPGSSIQMTLRREGRNAVLWVENRSAPIPPEKLGHLFDRFYRVDESRTGGEGFGLGLAIARTIVQSHRGSIGCTSAQGVTRFTVTLPLAKNEVTKRGSEA